jgi:hypothetical protein
LKKGEQELLPGQKFGILLLLVMHGLAEQSY